MLVLVFITLLIAYIFLKNPEVAAKNTLPDSFSGKIDKLWRAAQEAIIDKKISTSREDSFDNFAF